MFRSAFAKSLLFMALGFSFVSSLAQAATGRTQGTFNVSSSGGATYQIPIWMPAGPKGIQPNLALTYNSQAGTGTVGPGWSLSGLSAITRCNKTYAQDTTPAAITLSVNDGYCFNGNRLRLVSGSYGVDSSTYQTEIADFSKIVAHSTAGAGPAYFTVQGKDGLNYEYGNTTDSRVIAGSTAYLWLLNKVSDRSGNNYVVNYTAANTTNSAVPSSISYTPSSAGATSYNYTVNFSYAAAGSTVGYIAGIPISNANFLTGITIKNGSSIVRMYTLAYEVAPTTARARLSAVQECGGAAGTDCLAPTSITYQNGESGLSSVSSGTLSSTGRFVGCYDLNGDGLEDWVGWTGSQLTVAFATPSGYGAPVNTGITTTTVAIGNVRGNGQAEILANLGNGWWHYRWNTSTSSFAVSGSAVAPTESVSHSDMADVNGDGLADLITMRSDRNIYTRLNTSAGGTVSFNATTSMTNFANNNSWQSAGIYAGQSFYGKKTKYLDFNGDGRQDIVAYGLVQYPYGYVALSMVLLSQGTTFVLETGSTAIVAFADFNSDGCTDVFRSNAVYISTCNGTVATTLSLPSQAIAAMDWNHDGRTDVLINNGGTIGVYLSTGAGISGLITTSIPSTGVSYSVYDQNGDGLDDLVTFSTTSLNAISYRLHNSAGTPPDLVTAITDGYGVAFNLTYASIAQGNYTRASGATYPEEDIQTSLYVLKQVTTADGTGGAYTQSYNYTGARQDLQGRGFLGFQSITMTDSRADAPKVTTYYKTAFPFTGMVYQQDIFQHDGTTLISHTVNTPALTTLDGAANNQRYFPYVSASTTEVREVGGTKNGQLITTAAKTFTYDSYGNATTVTTTVTDNDSGSPYVGQQWGSTVVNTFSPDTGYWCLNLSTQTAVTNTAPDAASMTRTVSYTPDYPTCRIIQGVVEPASASYKVTTAYSFDSFGNIASQTVTGINMAARTTTVSWGVTGQFPLSITNALGQTTQAGYDFGLGVQTSQTDPNNLSTSWQYDNFGRKTLETRADGTSTLWTYALCSGCDPLPRLVATEQRRDINGTVLSTAVQYFDVFDRQIYGSDQLLDGSTAWTTMRAFDSLGRVSNEYFPYSAAGSNVGNTSYTYDALNRVLTASRAISASNSTVQTTSFQYLGRMLLTTDANGKQSTKINTVAGTLGRSQDHNGYYQSFGYDAFGSLKSVTDNQSNTLFLASYVYGIQPFQTSTFDMDLGTWGYTPNALGEVVAYTDPKHTNFTVDYDLLLRPTSRLEPGDGTTTWTWGNSAAAFNIGQLYSVSSTGGTTETYTYDNKGRLSNRHIVADGGYDYDYAYSGTTGFLDTLTYPTSTSSYRLKLQYSYQYGRLQKIKDYNASTVFWQANAMNPRGQITQETLGNGIVANRNYDAITGWLNYIQCGVGSGACAQNQSYLYDKVGNVTQRQNNDLGLTENFYYDNVNRLDYSQLNGVTNFDPSYDALGNITARSDVSNGATWTYDSVHKHQVLQAGSNTYSYDANGNVNNRNGYAISWTSYNYPSQINGPSETVNLYYDANRQRYKQVYTNNGSTETTMYIGGLLQKVTANGTADYRYTISANGQTVAIMSRSTAGTNVTRYVLNDYQGSVAKITNSDGSTYVSESFTAFGARRNPQTWSGQPTYGDQANINAVTRDGYTGQTALGNLGLNHMNGRVQDAIIGRFLSADPHISEPGNTQNYNRYSYVYNNPLSHTDPSGFFTCSYKVEAPYDPGQFIVVPGPCDLEEVLEEVVTTESKVPPPRPANYVIVHIADNIPSGFVPVADGNDGEPEMMEQGEKPDACKNAANAPTGLAAANKAFRNNTDPNKRFTVDASQLTVKQVGPMNTPGNGVVQGSDWLVFGRVDLVQSPSGPISILPNQYNFEQHDVTSSREFFRNIETYFGFYAATYGGLTEYWADLTGGNHATDFTFNFTCQPTVGK